MDLRSTLLVIGGSACSFKMLNTIVRFLPTPEPTCNKAWRWKNISTSLAHSSLTGVWAVSWCVRAGTRPQMVKDLISSHSLFSHSLVAVSTGYFIHDFMDVALNQPLKRAWEMLLHHSVVISCFSLAATSHLYLGLAVVSLLIEINSVFLHIRQLLLLSGQRNRPGTEITAPCASLAYSVTSWLNMGTLLVFRVCTMGWMIHWLVTHSEHMPRYVLVMGTVGMTLISIMNMVLFYRLFKADILNNTGKNH